MANSARQLRKLKLMKKHWWKALAVLILLYTFFMGLLVPLKPGLIDVEPAIIEAGKPVTFSVKGYNTNFLSEKSSLQAWLVRRDGKLIKPLQTDIADETTMQLNFEVPAFGEQEQLLDTLQLVIDNPLDGHFQSLVFRRQSEGAAGAALWQEQQVSLHEKKAFTYPFLVNVYESIRNLFYHVPMWFAMFIMAIASAVVSGLYLSSHDPRRDQQALALAKIVMLFGALGLITGAIWARNTWGDYWSNDPKQVYTAIGLLIYGAYFVLRASFEDPDKKGRIAAVYNIFAFATLVPLLYILPKLSPDSQHPGTGSNIAFGEQDLDNTMRTVFYPAIIGWTLMGVWMAQLAFRAEMLRKRLLERE